MMGTYTNVLTLRPSQEVVTLQVVSASSSGCRNRRHGGGCPSHRSLAHNRLRPGLPSQRGWTVINCSQRPISGRDNTNCRACPTVPILEWTVTTIVAKGTVQVTGTSGSGNTPSRCDTQCTPGLDVPRAALATVTFPRLQQARSWTVAPRPYCNKTLR